MEYREFNSSLYNLGAVYCIYVYLHLNLKLEKFERTLFHKEILTKIN